VNPDNIELENLSKNFEYFKYSSEIDKIENVQDLRDIAKSYYKLYLKQQEVISSLSFDNLTINSNKE